MSKKALLIILMAFNSWMPWTPQAKALIRETGAIVIFTGQPDFARGQYYSLQPPSFLINSNCEPEDLPMVTLHETQHLLGHLYASSFRNDQGRYLADARMWKKFGPLAIICAQEVAPEKMPSVMKFATLGGTELHAQLPWLLKGELCAELQPWYPWFDLSAHSSIMGSRLLGRFLADDM